MNENEAPDLFAPFGEQCRWRQNARLAAARIRVYGTRRPQPEPGIRLLRAALRDETDPVYEAWTLSDLSEYLALGGEAETALSLGQEACDVADRLGEPGEILSRKRDHVRLLLKLGRSSEAVSELETMLSSEGEGPTPTVKNKLLHAEGLLDLGERCNAHETLGSIYRDLDQWEELDHLRPQADALAHRFNAGETGANSAGALLEQSRRRKRRLKEIEAGSTEPGLQQVP